MASFDYVKARSVAKGLIEKFGEAGQFIVAGSGSGGYDSSGNIIPAEPDVVIDGLVTPPLSYKQMEVDGNQVLATDSYVFFHSEEEPPIDSKITINGGKYRAIDISKLDSVSGIRVYTKIQLRR